VGIKGKLIDSAPERETQTIIKATKEIKNQIFSKIKKRMHNYT
jgi:hypothetical protein